MSWQNNSTSQGDFEIGSRLAQFELIECGLSVLFQKEIYSTKSGNKNQLTYHNFLQKYQYTQSTSNQLKLVQNAFYTLLVVIKILHNEN